jgi:L-malate glycosyltransferase
MKIAILTSSFPRAPGDYQGNFVLFLARGLVKKGNDVNVICPHIPGTPFHEVMEGVEIHRIPYFYPYPLQSLSSDTGMYSALRHSILAWIQLPLFSLFLGYGAYRIIREQDIDLLHTHWFVPQGLIGSFLHVFLRIPHVATVHGSDLNILKKHTFLYPICRFIIRNSAFITVNSSYMKQQLLAVSSGCEQKIRVIPMGVDQVLVCAGQPVTVKHLEYTGPIILSVGRLIDWKGTKFLIESLPAVLKKFPGAQLHIAGAGPERESLGKLVCRLGLDYHVVFLGLVPSADLTACYLSADVFVLPSINKSGITEGLGVVLLEAMASGCPVIGSNVGGIPDIITDGENGFLVPEQDPDRLAHRIIRVLSDEDLRDKFRRNGYKRIKEIYSWEIISGRFSDVFIQTLREIS